MVYSATMYALLCGVPSEKYLQKQFLLLIFAVIICLFFSKLNYKVLDKFALPIYFIVFLFLVAVLFQKGYRGVHRWLKVWKITFQPSMLAKYAIIIFVSHILKDEERVKSFKRGVLPVIAFTLIYGALLGLEPSMGMMVLITLTAIATMIISGVKPKYILLIVLLLIGGFIFAAYKIPYVKHRIDLFLNRSSGQVRTAILGIGSGGLLGVGLGSGRCKMLVVAYPHTDFMFATIAEELGFVGVVMLFFLYFALMVRGFKIALKAPDRFSSLLSFGITFCIVLNAIIHIAVSTGLCPPTGLPLPFLSASGSALVSDFAAVGILLNISKKRIE